MKFLIVVAQLYFSHKLCGLLPDFSQQLHNTLTFKNLCPDIAQVTVYKAIRNILLTTQP